MNVDNKVLILNQDQIKNKIQRLAFQIYEDHFEETEIVLVGIADSGYVLAKRILQALEGICRDKGDKTFKLIRLEVDKEARTLISKLDTEVEEIQHKPLLIIDDVSNSGKTLLYGIGTFLNMPIKSIKTAVLVDRSHHRFPIAIDYYGLKLATTLKETVLVDLVENSEVSEDAAWLV